MDIRGRKKGCERRWQTPPKSMPPSRRMPVLRTKEIVMMPSAMPVPENSNEPVTVMITASTRDRRGRASRKCR